MDLVEAVLTGVDDRPLTRPSAWRMRAREDDGTAGGHAQPHPAPAGLVMTDAASGISAALDRSTVTFADVDLGVALHRPPRGQWLGMDATTVLGGTGAVQCLAVLFDGDGAIGRSSQSLFVEPR